MATGTGSVTLPALTLSGSGLGSPVWDGDVVLPMFTVSAVGRGPLTLPMFTVEADGLVGEAARAAMTLPAFEVSGDAIVGEVAVGAVRLPMFEVSATDGPHGSVTLPAFSVTATAVAGAVGTLASTLPAFTLSATVLSEGLADADVALPMFTVAGTAIGGAGAAGDIRLPMFALAADGVTGRVGTAALTLPMFEVDGTTGTLDNVGSATIELPMFVVEALGQAVVAAPTVTAVVLNTRNGAVSTWDGIAPNSATRFNGVTLLATAAGIVALTGDTDNGTAIAASLTLGKSTLGTAGVKRVLAAYVGYRASGELELTAIADDHHEAVYRLDPRQDNGDQHRSRVKVGKGLKGVYWQFTLANTLGCDFALDAIELHPALTGAGV